MKYLSLALLCVIASSVYAMEQDEKEYKALTPRHYLLKKIDVELERMQEEMEEEDNSAQERDCYNPIESEKIETMLRLIVQKDQLENILGVGKYAQQQKLEKFFGVNEFSNPS